MTEECRGMWTGHSYCRNAGSATATKIGPRSSWLLPNEDICHHRELPSTGNEHASQAEFRDSMSVCTHIHTCTHTHVLHTHTSVHAHACAQTRVHAHAHKYAHVHMCTHTQTRSFMFSLKASSRTCRVRKIFFLLTS